MAKIMYRTAALLLCTHGAVKAQSGYVCQTQAPCKPEYNDNPGLINITGEIKVSVTFKGMMIGEVLNQSTSKNNKKEEMSDTAVVFKRKEEYTINSVQTELSDTDILRSNFPNPYKGMPSVCASDKYFCQPGPCRILDVNYFGDPSYNTQFAENGILKKPSPRHFVPTSDDNSTFDIVGQSQCDPMFGNSMVLYDGSVFNPTSYNTPQDIKVNSYKSASSKSGYSYFVSYDNQTDLWPDVLPVPPVINKGPTQDNNNPTWMYPGTGQTQLDNKEQYRARKNYQCSDANNADTGVKNGVPAIWFEPVNGCNSGPKAPGASTTPCWFYKATTTYNKTAFTAAGAYWNSQKGCLYRCTHYAQESNNRFSKAWDDLNKDYDGPFPMCEDLCDTTKTPRRNYCSNSNGANDCFGTGHEHYAYSYEMINAWRYPDAVANKYYDQTFSPTNIECANSQTGTSRKTTYDETSLNPPFVHDGCYKTSTGEWRFPHGIVSTKYGSNFAFITTYPQLAISATRSHPGIFSSHAQAMGIVFKPSITNFSQMEEVFPTSMNRFIDWSEINGSFPQWEEDGSNCMVFTESRATGAGCSLLPPHDGKPARKMRRWRGTARTYPAPSSTKTKHQHRRTPAPLFTSMWWAYYTHTIEIGLKTPGTYKPSFYDPQRGFDYADNAHFPWMLDDNGKYIHNFIVGRDYYRLQGDSRCNTDKNYFLDKAPCSWFPDDGSGCTYQTICPEFGGCYDVKKCSDGNPRRLKD